MSRILVVFESRYGQSSKIAERIAVIARSRGHAAAAIEVTFAKEIDLRSHDAVFVVAPVYFSRHPRSLARFVAHRAERLSAIPSALVSVSGSASNPHREGRAEVRGIAERFCARAGWRPRTIATVAGAVAYPRYGRIVRMMMRAITKRKGGPLDTRRIHEMTNWDEVTDVATSILDMLPGAPKANERPTVPDALRM